MIDNLTPPATSLPDPAITSAIVVPRSEAPQPGASGVTVKRYLVCLLILIPFIVAGVYGWKQWQILQQQMKILQQSVDAVNARQILQSQEWQSQIDVLNKEILGLKKADRGDWLLAETEYLLRLANQHAILGHDAPAAVALLTQADKVLQDLTHPSDSQMLVNIRKIMAIRQQITEERDALVLRSDIDREGLYLQIEALIQQLDKIPVIDLNSLSENAAVAVLGEDKYFVPNSLGESILKNLRQALEKIGGYVRIQRHDEALKTLLTPGEQLYLKQNLRFMLEQAQIAVLQHQQSIYVNSLSKARTWITEYYVMDSALRKKLLAEVADIAGHNVEEPLPDISGSLTSLKAFMKLRHQQGSGE